jgi:hypothetical protein
MPADYRVMAQEAIKLTGDARFLEVAANAPHMVDFYWELRQIFFGGRCRFESRVGGLHLAQVHGCVL